MFDQGSSRRKSEVTAVSYVEQDAPVLSGTLPENLAFGAPGTTEVELAGVLGVTRLRDLVERLPDGLYRCRSHSIAVRPSVKSLPAPSLSARPEKIA